MKKLIALMIFPVLVMAQNPQAIQFPRGMKIDSVFSLGTSSILFRIEQGRNVLRLWDDSTVVWTGNTRALKIDASQTLNTYAFGSNSKAVALLNSADSLAYLWAHFGGTGGRQIRMELAVTGSGTAADGANARLAAYPYGQLYGNKVGITSSGIYTVNLGHNQFAVGPATAIYADSIQHKWGINISGTPTYKMQLSTTGLYLLSASTGNAILSPGSSAADFTLYLPVRNGDSIATKQMFNSIAYSDSTWWWNKRDTASSPGVPTINRMLDSLADVQSRIAALKPATAVYSDSTAKADWAKVANKPFTFASMSAVDSTKYHGSASINTVGILTAGVINWTGAITTTDNIQALTYNSTGNDYILTNDFPLHLQANTITVGPKTQYFQNADGTIALTTDKPAAAVYSDSTARADWAKVTNKPFTFASMSAVDSTKYHGSASITTLGTVGTGNWTASVIEPTYGGTGQNSSAWNGFAFVDDGTWSAVALGSMAYADSTTYHGNAGLTTVGILTPNIQIGGYATAAGNQLVVTSGATGAATATIRVGTAVGYAPTISWFQNTKVEWVAFVPADSTNLKFATGGGNAMSLSTGGNMILAGTLTQSGEPSDAKWKKNVRTASEGLNVVMNLHPKKYKWDYKENWMLHGKEDIGLIAQEVESVFPLAVTKKVDSLGVADYAIRYQRFVPVFINAFQEQQAQIDNLKKEVADLKRKKQ